MDVGRYTAFTVPKDKGTKYEFVAISDAVSDCTLLILFVHVSICPSVRLSLCPIRACNLKTKKCRKLKWLRRSPWHEYVECHFSFRKVKGQGHMTYKPPKSGVIFTYGSQHWWIKCSRCWVKTVTMPLLGLIYCRRLRWSITQELERHMTALQHQFCVLHVTNI